MSKRFGRNQKRRMREQMAALEVQSHDVATNYERQLRIVRQQLSQAEARAFDRFMADKDRYEYICARMADQVARVAGENLKPYAEQLMRAANKHRPMVRFDAASDFGMMTETVITVEWPAVRLRQVLMG